MGAGCCLTVLFDRRRGAAHRQLFHVRGNSKRTDRAQFQFPPLAPTTELPTACAYAARVLRLRIVATKNSTNRLLARSPGHRASSTVSRTENPRNDATPRVLKGLSSLDIDCLQRARRDSNPQPPDRQSSQIHDFRLKNAIAAHTDTSLLTQKQGQPVSRHRPRSNRNPQASREQAHRTRQSIRPRRSGQHSATNGQL